MHSSCHSTNLIAVALNGEVRLNELEAVGEGVGGGELDLIVLLVLPAIGSGVVRCIRGKG
jgi:hypothetical protein